MRGLLDTSILIALVDPDEDSPDLSGFTALAISSLSLSEMHMGVAAAAPDSAKRAVRASELDKTRATFGAGIPYDDLCALAFGVVSDEVVRNGGSPKSHLMDKMIAATAMARGLVLVTRNAEDLKHLGQLVQVEER